MSASDPGQTAPGGSPTRANLIRRISFLEDSLAYERQRNSKLENKMYHVRKSRDEYLRLVADLREQVEALQTMLDTEDL